MRTYQRRARFRRRRQRQLARWPPRLVSVELGELSAAMCRAETVALCGGVLVDTSEEVTEERPPQAGALVARCGQRMHFMALSAERLVLAAQRLGSLLTLSHCAVVQRRR